MEDEKSITLIQIDEKKRPYKAYLIGQKKKLGNDLLSHTLVCSTIGDEGLDF